MEADQDKGSQGKKKNETKRKELTLNGNRSAFGLDGLGIPSVDTFSLEYRRVGDELDEDIVVGSGKTRKDDASESGRPVDEPKEANESARGRIERYTYRTK